MRSRVVAGRVAGRRRSRRPALSNDHVQARCHGRLVDRGARRWLLRLWAAGVETTFSCQGGARATVYVSLKRGEDLDRAICLLPWAQWKADGPDGCVSLYGSSWRDRPRSKIRPGGGAR